MRSYYLDDMKVSPGVEIICKADLAGHFTPGKCYKVLEKGKMKDDQGNIVIPSARFYMRQVQSQAEPT